jgi:hypothetical protein
MKYRHKLTALETVVGKPDAVALAPRQIPGAGVWTTGFDWPTGFGYRWLEQDGVGLARWQQVVPDCGVHGSESGKVKDRPQLMEAMRVCRLCKAKLLIAKLNRLARNVAFISNLMNNPEVEFVVMAFLKPTG